MCTTKKLIYFMVSWIAKKSGITYIKTILQRFICKFSFTR